MEWLGWKTTLEMLHDVVYEEYGYESPQRTEDVCESMQHLLWAAYNAGALGMAIHLGVVKE